MKLNQLDKAIDVRMEDWKRANPGKAFPFPSKAGKRTVEGRFFMVQSDLVCGEEHNDRFGHPTVHMPGRSLMTEPEAIKAAEALAEKNPGRTFFVMAAVKAITAKKPAVNFVRKNLK